MAFSLLPAELLLKIVDGIESIRDLSAFVQINRQCYNAFNMHLHSTAMARPLDNSVTWAMLNDRSDIFQNFIHAGLFETPASVSHDGIRLILVKGVIFDTAFWGSCKILRFLIEYAFNQEVPLEHTIFQNALDYAAMGGHVQALDTLIEYHGDLNLDHIDEDGFTLLYDASTRNNGAVIKWLVDHGADLHLPCHDDPGYTPLHRAAELDNLDAIRALVHCGMSPNGIDCHGLSPFHYAILFQCDEGAELEESTAFLLQNGADPYLRTSHGYTPLWLATCLGKWKTVDLLLEMGVSPDDSDENGNIQESISIQPFLDMRTYKKNVQQRLTSGTRSRKCGTPLFTAGQMGENKILSSLLRHGAEPNCMDSNGDMPLHLAVNWLSGSFKEGALELIRYGASLNAKDGEGLTPLDRALQRGHLDIACLLIEQGADIQQLDSNGVDPIFRIFDYWCSQMHVYTEYDLKGIQSTCRIGWTREVRHSNNDNCEKVFSLFLERGSSVHSRDDLERTVLHIATSRGCEETMKYLLKMGADPNARDVFGHTPIHKVAIATYADGVRALAKYDGVDFMAKDNHGNTALHLAAQEPQLEGALDTMFAFDSVGLSPDDLENLESLGVNNGGQSVMDIIRAYPHSAVYQALALESSSSESDNSDRDC